MVRVHSPRPFLSAMNFDILLLIPAFNEENFLDELLTKVQNHFPPDQILVVNDGSTDRTEAIAKSHGVNIISHFPNRGKGFSLNRGFDYAIEHGFDAVITMDADLQHDPDEIPLFVEAYARGCDLVIGSRWKDMSNMPLDRYLSNRLTTTIVSAIAGRKVEDSQSGYRLISTDVLRKVRVKASHYDAESELIVKAARAGFKLCNVPIKTIYGQESSSINKFMDTYRFIKLVFRLIFFPS